MSTARCGGLNDAAITRSGPSAKSSSTPASGNRAAHQAPVLPAWSAHAAALSKLAISSATRATVRGSTSRPPRERGVNMRKSPAARMASSTGGASRRSRSAASACARMTGSSARALASRSLAGGPFSLAGAEANRVAATTGSLAAMETPPVKKLGIQGRQKYGRRAPTSSRRRHHCDDPDMDQGSWADGHAPPLGTPPRRRSASGPGQLG